MRMTASWSGPYRPTEYKFAARGSAPESGLPSDRHPDHNEHAVVLGAFKVWPGGGGACGKIGATANLDGSCARAGVQYMWVGAKKRDSKSNKETGMKEE